LSANAAYSSGFDKAARGFHERLDLAGDPIRNLPRRLMVPARQIVVYAQSSLLGWHSNGAHLAPEAFEAASMEIPAGRFPSPGRKHS
jgi:mannose/cellobiose epimerase-like protein (N-acyl-D-glucosamine 2-epimerase family)